MSFTYWDSDSEYDGWINELLEKAPERFDGDEAAEAIVVKYIRWLEAAQVNLPEQHDVLEWVEQRWPDYTTPERRALKLGEEAGEVLGAVIKEPLGQKPPGSIAQETAQVVICALALAEAVGFDLLDEVRKEWTECATRVWPSEP